MVTYFDQKYVLCSADQALSTECYLTPTTPASYMTLDIRPIKEEVKRYQKAYDYSDEFQ